jgi:hypothetical protein
MVGLPQLKLIKKTFLIGSTHHYESWTLSRKNFKLDVHFSVYALLGCTIQRDLLYFEVLCELKTIIGSQPVCDIRVEAERNVDSIQRATFVFS